MVNVSTVNATEPSQDINSMKSAETTASPTITSVGSEHQADGFLLHRNQTCQLFLYQFIQITPLPLLLHLHFL